MSPLTAFLPAAASAATSLATSAARGIAEGVSFAAELARGNRRAASPADAGPDVQSLPAELQQAIDRLAELIRQRLAVAGIDLAQPLSLSGDGLGGLEISDHPQAGTIESLLADDATIADAFHQLAARYEKAIAGADPVASSLAWDQTSAGRHVAIQIDVDLARVNLL